MSRLHEYRPSTKNGSLKGETKECHIRQSVFSFDSDYAFCLFILLILLIPSFLIVKIPKKPFIGRKKQPDYQNTFCPKLEIIENHHAVANVDVEASFG